MSIRERALAKADDVREQIRAIDGGAALATGAGVPLGTAASLEFQRWRLAWLEKAANWSEQEVLDESIRLLAHFALNRDLSSRVALDICRLVLGCESLEELLVRLEQAGERR